MGTEKGLNVLAIKDDAPADAKEGQAALANPGPHGKDRDAEEGRSFGNRELGPRSRRVFRGFADHQAAVWQIRGNMVKST